MPNRLIRITRPRSGGNREENVPVNPDITRHLPGALPLDSPNRLPFTPDHYRTSTPANEVGNLRQQTVELTREDQIEEEEVDSHLSKLDPDTTVQQISLSMEAAPRQKTESGETARIPEPPRFPASQRMTGESSAAEREEDVLRGGGLGGPDETRGMWTDQRYGLQPEVFRQSVQPVSARAATMPARNSNSAPKFDSKNPRTLTRYFTELELLFRAAQIVDPQTKKEHVLRYLENDDYEIWSSLTEAQYGYSYSEFKTAVMDSYPGAEVTRKYNLSDVTELTDKWRREGITTSQGLGEYYRDFRNITNYLIGQSRLSEMEQRRMFVRGFSQDFLDRIAYKLQTTHPEVDPEDGFGMDAVYKAALALLRGSSFFRADSETRSTSASRSIPSSAPYVPPASRSVPAVPTTTASPALKQDDLISVLGKLVTAFNSSGGTANNTIPQRPAAPRFVPTTTPASTNIGATMVPATMRRGPSDAERCNFCGATGHFMSSCPTADEYLRNGKVTRRADGKLVLPNGMFVPRSIEGEWLKDRLDTWWQQKLGDQANVNSGPSQVASATIVPVDEPAATMYYQVENHMNLFEEDRGSFASVVSDKEEEDLEEQIEYYQSQILAIQAKQRKKTMVFDGVEIVKRPFTRSATGQGRPASKPSSGIGGSASTSDKGKERAATPVSETPESGTPGSANDDATATKDIPQVPVGAAETPAHPFEKARDANYLPPVNRNLGAPVKPKEREPAYHTQAPIQDSKFIETVLERSLKETHITLTFEELLSLSPDLRYRIRDKVTPKRQQPTKNVSFAGEEEIVEEIVSPSALAEELEATRVAPGRYRVPDLAQVLYSAQKRIAGDNKIVLQSKKESLASRAITMKVAERSDVECILDPGSEIVCMSDAVCNQLGIPYDPTVTIKMQSANGDRDPTLGLARDVSFEIGDFVLLFQVHVVKSPAYDILLGRPFDDLTNAKIENLANEEQVCTIRDPGSDRAYCIPTVARGPPRFSMKRAGKDFQKASRN